MTIPKKISKKKMEYSLKNLMHINNLGKNRHFGADNPAWKGGNRVKANYPCIQCGRDRITEKRYSHRICKYCYDHREKKFNWNKWRMETYTESKEIAIQYKGGKCVECGIADLPNCCYHFHHVKEKRFNLGHKFNQKLNEDIFIELDRCILLCANCHAILTWVKNGIN